jgi:hypothetical protein
MPYMPGQAPKQQKQLSPEQIQKRIQTLFSENPSVQAFVRLLKMMKDHEVQPTGYTGPQDRQVPSSPMQNIQQHNQRLKDAQEGKF